MKRSLFTIGLVIVLGAAFALPAQAQESKVLLITSFEADGEKAVTGDGKIVDEKASDGKKCYKINHSGDGFTGMEIADKASLAKFKDFVLFKVDVFNPTNDPIVMGVRADDGKSKDFGSRFQDERGAVAAPGWSTYELNLTGLTRSNSKNYFAKDRLDVGDLKLIKIFVSGKPITLYFDNVRLEASGLPEVAGLKAFDFGPSKSAVYPGFEGAGEKSIWKDDAEFGWVKPTAFDNVYMPDVLTGDYGSGKEFKVKLPNGKYEVQTCIDSFGIWGQYPRFTSRSVTINGKKVLEQKMTPQEFLDKVFFAHEHSEDLPGQDLWDKFIATRNVNRHFKDIEVTDGTLTFSVASDLKYGAYVQYLVVYPQDKSKEGQAWMDSLTKKRKDWFNKSMIVRVPNPTTQPSFEPTAAEKAAGFVTFPGHSENFLFVNTVPAREIVGKPLTIAAARGERENAVLGLFPTNDVAGMSVSVSDLAGPGGAKIASTAVTARKIRNFLKRQSRTRVGNILPWLLEDFKTLDLKVGVTRGVWLTVVVPADAAAGEYTGSVKLTAAGKSVEVPVKLTVYPFALDKVTDITFSATGCRSSIPSYFPEYKDLVWEHAEKTMKSLADHNMNAVCGGVGARLVSVKDGKVEIDYTDMDKWMALATKHGLTMPGDSYQGCDVNGLPRDTKKDAIAVNEKAAQEQFGISYEQLVKLVYEDVEKHAKEKGWPVRSYFLLDEPRPEFGNIEAAAEMIKLYTKAAPNTRFSGYYSVGSNREQYFETMPVSISHMHPKALEHAKKGGKEIWVYDGSRNRASAGRWAFVAAKAGMKGYLTNGFMYVNSDPYFDFSDDEAAWCVAWPGRDGVVDSVAYERVSDGIDDYRYLTTLAGLIKKSAGDNASGAAAQAAQKFMDDSLKGIELEHSSSAAMTAAQCDAFKAACAEHITKLKTALVEK